LLDLNKVNYKLPLAATLLEFKARRRLAFASSILTLASANEISINRRSKI